MKPFITVCFIFLACISFSQQDEYHMQGQIVDSEKNPIPDVYVINLRDQSQHISRQNGVFDIWLLPSDTLAIIHVTYLRKFITAFDLLKNPVIELVADTVSINQVNVYSTNKTDYQRAMENIQQIDFDPRPSVNDSYSESERMQQLLQTENKVERAAANSLTYQFSPSEMIGKIIDKIQLRKKSSQYDSTKKSQKKQEP